MRTYEVYISKYYFPRHTWPPPFSEKQMYRFIKANSRTEAANKFWEKYGKTLLKDIKQCDWDYGRRTKQVSLYVSGNGNYKDPSFRAGRLTPIVVWKE